MDSYLQWHCFLGLCCQIKDKQLSYSDSSFYVPTEVHLMIDNQTQGGHSIPCLYSL